MHRAPLLCVLLLAMLTGCSSRTEQPAAATAADPEVIPATAMEINALAAAPGARATLVNVWATWCAPCRQEFPAMLKVARENRANGLRLVLVSADFDDQLAAIRRFLVQQGVHDTTYLKSGDDMSFINGLGREWTGALPATFVYDAHGKRVAFWEGVATEQRFRDAIHQALASTP